MQPHRKLVLGDRTKSNLGLQRVLIGIEKNQALRIEFEDRMPRMDLPLTQHKVLTDPGLLPLSPLLLL